MSKMILVSSCLAGIRCRYNGTDFKIDKIEQMVLEGKAIPLCPEVMGGLDTPRACCEIIINSEDKRLVISENGDDCTDFYENGARKAQEIARILEIDTAILKSRSPSCGYGKIYNGTFSGKLIKGNGIAAEKLAADNIRIFTEEDFEEALEL